MRWRRFFSNFSIRFDFSHKTFPMHPYFVKHHLEFPFGYFNYLYWNFTRVLILSPLKKISSLKFIILQSSKDISNEPSTVTPKLSLQRHDVFTGIWLMVLHSPQVTNLKINYHHPFFLIWCVFLWLQFCPI